MDLWENRKPLIQQEKTAKMIANIIPSSKLAVVISNSCAYDWIAIRDILYFISYFDSEKFISGQIIIKTTIYCADQRSIIEYE